MAAPDALEVLESVPQRAPAQPAPESFQVTPLLCGSFCTVAMKLWERLTGTVCTTGRTETVTCGAPGTIEMFATPDGLLVLDMVPHALALQLAPEILQVTPLFCVSFWTVAVKF